jgi:hypothetical protein
MREFRDEIWGEGDAGKAIRVVPPRVGSGRLINFLTGIPGGYADGNAIRFLRSSLGEKVQNIFFVLNSNFGNMKTEIISQLHSSFELAVNETDGVEYWFARDLQELLGYTKWENFIKVIDKGKTACANAKQATSDHFLDVRKMVDLGSGYGLERCAITEAEI